MARATSDASGQAFFGPRSERKRPKPAGLRALVSTYRINDKAVVAGCEPTLHLRGRSSCPAGSRRGNDAERVARRTRCQLAVFLPNKVITTRITFLACTYRAVGRYATADVQVHCPGTAGLLRLHLQLALWLGSSVDLIACGV